MKITSYNISRFRGNYKKGSSLLEVREYNMRRFFEFIDKEGLLQSADDIILLQEAPYRQNQTQINKRFMEIFNEKYKVIEPLYERKDCQSAVMALTLKDSNWRRWETVGETKFPYTEIITLNKLLELENKKIKFSLLNMHITEGNIWNCLSKTLENYKYTFIVGDLNAHNNEHRGKENMSPEKLELITSKGYKDLVPDNYVTYYSAKTTVDHIFYNTDQIKADEGEFSLIPTNLSDHVCLTYKK